MTLTPENVQDYPRPPALEKVAQLLRVVRDDEVIAETKHGWRVLETHHAPTYYIPREDVRMNLLSSSRRVSHCEWKGRAAYFHIGTSRDAAWSYPAPTKDFTPIKDMIAFYAGAVDACYVGEERVIPQPGDFYGGWVTANLTGKIKGAAGTMGW